VDATLSKWLRISLEESWLPDLESTFPFNEWVAATTIEQDHHKAFLAAQLFRLAWPEAGDSPATKRELEDLCTSEPLKGKFLHGEYGQAIDESWMQIVDYAVVDLPTGRLVRTLRPGLLVAGRVVRKAQVVISR